jgi:hypothetical protein
LTEKGWLRYYFPECQKFLEEKVLGKSDYLMPVQRKGAVVLETFDTKSQRIIYPESLNYMVGAERLRPGSSIAILDDAVQKGTSIAHVLGEIRRKYGSEVKVECFCFLLAKRYEESGKLKIERIHSRFKLDDFEFREATRSLYEFIDSLGRPLETDHICVQLKKEFTGINGNDLANYLSQFGSVYFVPSLAEERGVISLTLSEPVFFDLSELRCKGVYDNGVCKIRIYVTDTGSVYLYPMCFPELNLTEWQKDGNEEFLEQFKAIMDEGWEESIKKEFLFVSLQLECMSILASRTLQILESYFRSPIQFTLIEENLRRTFGSRTGNGILDALLKRIENYRLLKFRSFQKESLPSPRGQNIQRVKNEIEGLIEKSFDFDYAKEKPYDQILKEGVTYKQIIEKLSWVPRIQINRVLDGLCQQGVVIPYNTLEDNCWTRRYRLGEIKIKNTLAGNTDDDYFKQWNVIVAICLQTLRNLLKPDIRLGGVIANKVLVCLLHDFVRLKRKCYAFPRANFFGPVAVHPPSEYYAWNQDNAVDLMGLTKYGMIQFDDGRKEFSVVRGALDDDRKRILPELERGVVESYASMYAEIINVDGDTSRITALATCRTEELTYEYAYDELRIWSGNFYLGLCHSYKASSQSGSTKNTILTKGNEFFDWSAKAYEQIREKINLYGRMPKILQSLESVELKRKHGEKIQALGDSIRLEQKYKEDFERLLVAHELLWHFTSWARHLLSLKGLALNPRGQREQKTFEERARRLASHRWLSIDAIEKAKLEDTSLDEEAVLMKVEQIFNVIKNVLLTKTGQPTELFRKTEMDRDFIIQTLSELNKLVRDTVKIEENVFLKVDKVKFSPKSVQSPLEAAADVEALNTRITPLLKLFDGKLIWQEGDASLIGFRDSRSACRFSLELRENLQLNNRHAVDDVNEVHIGIHHCMPGTNIQDNSTSFGPGPTIASRLCDLAEGMQILVTSDLANDAKSEFDFSAIGRRLLRNLGEFELLELAGSKRGSKGQLPLFPS